MEKLILAVFLLVLTSCVGSGQADSARTLLEVLEFEGEEYGSIIIVGDIALGIPPFASKIHISYEKHKDPPVFEDN